MPGHANALVFQDGRPPFRGRALSPGRLSPPGGGLIPPGNGPWRFRPPGGETAADFRSVVDQCDKSPIVPPRQRSSRAAEGALLSSTVNCTVSSTGHCTLRIGELCVPAFGPSNGGMPVFRWIFGTASTPCVAHRTWRPPASRCPARPTASHAPAAIPRSPSGAARDAPLAQRVRIPPDASSKPLLARTLGKGPGGRLFPASGRALPPFAHNWPLTRATHTRKRRLPRVRGASTIRASNCPSGRTDAGICNPDMASPPCKSSERVHRVGPSMTPAESTGAVASRDLSSNIPADTTGARIRQTAG